MFETMGVLSPVVVRPPIVESRLRSCGARGSRILALCVLLMLLRVSPASAQISGAIGGTVTDESGAAVSDAQVIAKNTETTAERETTTDSGGHYQLSSLPLGPYEVRATKQGFATEVRTGIRVVVNEEGTVNLTLKIGSVSQQITIEGDAPLVSVTTKDISGLVGEQQVKDLPLNGRSYDLLLPLRSGDCEFRFAEGGRYRRIELYHGQQLCGLGQPAPAKSVPSERCGICGGCREQHDAGRREWGTVGRGCGAGIQRAARFVWSGIWQETGRADHRRDAVRCEPVAWGTL